MHYSSQDRLHQKRQRILSKEDLSGLSPEERQFAQQQFRLIYAQQMSRITADMSHKKKVLDNLNTLDEIQSKNLKQQYEKLKTKMASIQQNRNKKLEQKMKSYKQNDERWFHKLKQIQNKFKQQNREAIEKAKKYREESQNYWKNKEKKMQDISRTNFENSRAIKNQESLHRSFIVEKQKSKNKFRELDGHQKRFTINQQFDNRRSHRDHSTSKVELDDQIRLHKQKSDQLQRQKQTVAFQKALQKMDKIQKTRAKANKDKQSKVSEPTKPKIVDYSHASMGRKNQNQNRNRNHSNAMPSLKRENRSKDSLQKLIKDHLEVKQKLEQQQFNQRGEMFENSLQKARKDKIMRMIKNKVQEIKVNTMMREGSINNLIA